jgi:hypothetical protein
MGVSKSSKRKGSKGRGICGGVSGEYSCSSEFEVHVLLEVLSLQIYSVNCSLFSWWEYIKKLFNHIKIIMVIIFQLLSCWWRRFFKLWVHIIFSKLLKRMLIVDLLCMGVCCWFVLEERETLFLAVCEYSRYFLKLYRTIGGNFRQFWMSLEIVGFYYFFCSLI